MITWDFDVIKGDVIFTVFRHKRPKEACSGSLTSLGESPSCGVIANVDAVVVEKPKTCHDGDSIQVRVRVRFVDVDSVVVEKRKTFNYAESRWVGGR